MAAMDPTTLATALSTFMLVIVTRILVDVTWQLPSCAKDFRPVPWHPRGNTSFFCPTLHPLKKTEPPRKSSGNTIHSLVRWKDPAFPTSH